MSNRRADPLDDITQREGLDIAYQQLGKRLHPGTTISQIRAILGYKNPEPPLSNSPVNAIRDTLMAHMKDNADQLSLPCCQDCYQHSDAVVLRCYLEYRRDVELEEQLADIGDL